MCLIVIGKSLARITIAFDSLKTESQSKHVTNAASPCWCPAHRGAPDQILILVLCTTVGLESNVNYV